MNWQKLILPALIIFILTHLFTMKIEAPLDGHNTIGFPFTFYIDWSTSCKNCQNGLSEMNLSNLVLDILVALVLAIGVVFLFSKFLHQKEDLSS